MKYIRICSADSDIKRGNNKRVVVIDGNEIKDIPDFYDQLAQQLDFPDYFGANLDALYDMLTDLQWIKHDTIELIICHFDQFLSEESITDKAEMVLLLEQASQVWKEGNFDDEEWEMKNFRVYLVGDERLRDVAAGLIASIEEEE